MRTCVVGAVVLAAVAAGCGSRGATTFTTSGISWATTGEGPQPAVAAEARALAVARGSALVRRLLGPSPRLLESFVWLGTPRRPRVVELAYRLPRARVVDAVVPFALNPPDAPAKGDCVTPYAPGWKRLRAPGTTVVFVGVDVVTRRVADVETNAARQIESSVPGRAFPTCTEIPGG